MLLGRGFSGCAAWRSDGRRWGCFDRGSWCQTPADRPVVRADQVTLGVLVSEVARDVVDDAVAVCGVREKRSDGKLPSQVAVYLTLGLCLFPNDDYEEVATKVTGSLDRWGCWNAGWSAPTSSAVSQARKRLGRKVFAELFERCCAPVAGKAGPAAAMTATGTGRAGYASATST
jgi:Insertion element 4 transposase N-terminal